MKGERQSARAVVRLLGPTQIEIDDRQLVPPPGRMSTLLALLAIDAGRVVSVDHLMDQLWGDDLPRSGSATLQVYISRLRRVLDQAGLSILRRPPGYVLDVPRQAVDVHLLADHLAAAEAATRQAQWSAAYEEAQAARLLLRGRAFADTTPCPDLDAEAERIDQLASRADELAGLALVKLDRAGEALPLAVDLCERHPLEENYWWLRMVSAQRSGRSALALEAYETYRSLLADELGLDPGPKLAELQLTILRNEPPPGQRGSTIAPAAAPVDVDERLAPGQPSTALVARAAELATLRAWVEATFAGSGGLVLIEGEAGVGKTYLAEMATTHARDLGAGVVWTRAIEGPGTPAMWMWEQVLDAVGDAGESGADQLRHLAEASSAELSGERAEQARFRLSEALVRVVVRASRKAPLVLVFDDVQWADLGTLQTLRLLTDALTGHPLGVIITARTERADAGLDDTLVALARSTAVQHLALRPFSTAEVAAYVRGVRGAGPETDEAEALHIRSGGNAFLLSELLRSGPELPGVPRTVGQLVARRLAQLPQDTQALLQVAAVHGRRVDLQVVARALDLTTLDALARTEPAVQAGILSADGPPGRWLFAHDLTREAIIATVPAVRVVALHAQLARAIEDAYAEQLDDHVDELAHHLFESAAGSPSSRAFAACMAAADLAADRLAYDQAARQRTRALATMVTDLDTRRQRFAVLLQLTHERRLAGDVLGAAASLRQAIDVARRLEDRRLLIRAVSLFGGVTLWNWRQFGQVDRATVDLLRDLLEPDGIGEDAALAPRERAELSGALSVELYYDPEAVPERIRFAEEAVRLAREVQDPALLGRAVNNFVVATWSPESDEHRHRMLDESLSWSGRGLPPVTEVVSRLHRAPLLLQAGQVAAADTDLDRAAALAPRLGILEIEGQVDSQLAGRALLGGDRDLTVGLIDRTHAELQRTNLWGAEWVRLVQLSTLARLDGRLPELTGQLVAKASEDVQRSLRWTALLALAESGELQQARALQSRWNLRNLDQHSYWGSMFEWAQAAEVALLLGSPAPVQVYGVLSPVGSRIVVAGTGLAVWGPAASLLSRLAERLGDAAGRERWRAVSDTVTARVTADLGASPCWVYPE